MIDIVKPAGNEKELIKMALALGIRELVFYYDKIPEEKIKSEVQIYYASPSKGDILIVESRGSEKDRHVLEKTNTDCVYSFEENRKKDKVHHRGSGLNQVLCKIMKDKKKIIVYNFNLVLNSKGADRARIMGRIKQNIKFCRKYKVQQAIASFASTPFEMRALTDLKSFGIAMGMHQSEAKKALELIQERVEQNKSRKTGKRVAEGIEVVG